MVNNWQVINYLSLSKAPEHTCLSLWEPVDGSRSDRAILTCQGKEP